MGTLLSPNLTKTKCQHRTSCGTILRGGDMFFSLKNPLYFTKYFYFHGDIVIFGIYRKKTSPTKMWMHSVKSESSSKGRSCWILLPYLISARPLIKYPIPAWLSLYWPDLVTQCSTYQPTVDVGIS